MKQLEITKAIKAELWRIFDAGHNVANITINGHALPAEAVEKQRRLWQEHRKRNPRK